MSHTSSIQDVLNGPELITWLLSQNGRFYPNVSVMVSLGLPVVLNELSPKNWPVNLERINEAKRFKEQRSRLPFYAKSILEYGDLFWLKFAASYSPRD